MKRVICLFSILSLCLIANGLGQSTSKSRPKKGCPFSIAGTWKSEATNETNPVFYQFLPEGWARVLGHTADTLPKDFEILAEVQYKLDSPTSPKRLDIIASGGNEVFPSGTTSLEITEYGDDRFTSVNPESGELTRWERSQTHRYFLTLAARSGPASQSAAALAFWTVLDGRNTELNGLGLQPTKDETGKPMTIFAAIPAELAHEFESESRKESDVMLRLELSEGDYARTHSVLETWQELIQKKALSADDPAANALKFFKLVVDNLNQCGKEAKLHKLDQAAVDDLASKYGPAQRPLEYIRVMRKKNDELHVADRAFPWIWKPMLISSQQ